MSWIKNIMGRSSIVPKASVAPLDLDSLDLELQQLQENALTIHHHFMPVLHELTSELNAIHHFRPFTLTDPNVRKAIRDFTRDVASIRATLDAAQSATTRDMEKGKLLPVIPQDIILRLYEELDIMKPYFVATLAKHGISKLEDFTASAEKMPADAKDLLNDYTHVVRAMESLSEQKFFKETVVKLPAINTMLQQRAALHRAERDGTVIDGPRGKLLDAIIKDGPRLGERKSNDRLR